MTREEAIKKIRQMSLPKETREILEALAPELRESEDERIRKSLIKFLTDIKRISESGRTTWAVREEDAEMCKSSIAYLEKQKEEEGMITVSKEAWDENAKESFERGIKVGMIRQQKEQKPAEWSKEDEKMINTIVSVLGQYIDYKAVSGTGSGYATPRYSKEIAWLKSLRPSWKPSEEQMKAFKNSAEYIPNAYYDDMCELYEQLKKLV